VMLAGLGEKRDCREFITSNARGTECTLRVQREYSARRRDDISLRAFYHAIKVASSRKCRCSVLCNCELSFLTSRDTPLRATRSVFLLLKLGPFLRAVHLQLYSFNEPCVCDIASTLCSPRPGSGHDILSLKSPRLSGSVMWRYRRFFEECVYAFWQ